ncbi:hypothetical protein RHS03_07912, partial [Rhizoctonia solani]
MSESLKGLGREEVAARRAALTDGRWRNREGIGMYQRSTSNALRNILSGVKSALPSLSRARSKSRSRSVSPKKRAVPASQNPVTESPRAGPSRLAPDPSPARPALDPSPARSTRSRRSSVKRKSLAAAATSASLISPRATSSPRKTYLSPNRKSYLSPFRKTNPSPLRKSIFPRSPTKSPTRKSPAARPKAQAKSKSKLKVNKGKVPEPEPVAPASPGRRRASVRAIDHPEEEVSRAPELQDEGSTDEAEYEGLATVEEEPEPEPEPELQPELEPEPEPGHETLIHQDTGKSGDGADESVVVLMEEEEHPPPKASKGKGKAKGKAKSRAEQDTTGADDSVMVLEEEAPAPPPKKNRIQTIVPEPVQRQKPARSRKASGNKRPAVEDDEEQPEGSPPKRAKSTKGKSKTKAKAPAKKGKTTKAKPRGKKTGASRAISVESDPEPERTTPVPQDIMVPLQDSPPPRPKDSKRRRYTLMPVRTKEEMAHPDYDPIDCIGWQ